MTAESHTQGLMENGWTKSDSFRWPRETVSCLEFESWPHTPHRESLLIERSFKFAFPLSNLNIHLKNRRMNRTLFLFLFKFLSMHCDLELVWSRGDSRWENSEITLNLLGICHLLIKVGIYRGKNCVPVGEEFNENKSVTLHIWWCRGIFNL